MKRYNLSQTRNYCGVVATEDGAWVAFSDAQSELAKKDVEIAKLRKDRFSVTLTGQQLQEALEFVAPDREPDQLETEITFRDWEGHSGPGVYVYLTEYPEEGAMALFDAAAEEQAK